ncbi:hypothetical protein P4S83_06670 [Aneurinibacillus thermoaerophilus]|jgi:PBP1b-binding outer membrane lipoprotein LpoB|uniref:hypothetical protein n=1 Tax=Aneurinibacillus thermoaerophilus TaxID=143495 RepID=UPI002E251EA6|nr:hypothetical protein [Aneurinibacillus thermoaerophilus]MED0764117.1 hypothetical protein [Aneurinibacillus thermoaerophilus]
MAKRLTHLLVFLLCCFMLAGCTEYGTKTVESITDKEIKATYETYNKTITRKVPSIPDTVLAIQLHELQFKKGRVTIAVTDPGGKTVFEKTFEPGTYQDGYSVHFEKEGEYEIRFAFEHVENGKHHITWETD